MNYTVATAFPSESISYLILTYPATSSFPFLPHGLPIFTLLSWIASRWEHRRKGDYWMLWDEAWETSGKRMLRCISAEKRHAGAGGDFVQGCFHASPFIWNLHTLCTGCLWSSQLMPPTWVFWMILPLCFRPELWLFFCLLTQSASVDGWSAVEALGNWWHSWWYPPLHACIGNRFTLLLNCVSSKQYLWFWRQKLVEKTDLSYCE